MFLWCTDETEHNVFQGVGTSTGHVSSWGGCLWCETGRHLPTVIASSKCPQPATGLAAPQHKLPNCDLAISASSWQFFSYWFLQRGLISSFGAFLSSRQCSFIVDGARILWHGHRLFNGQEGVTHSHNSESIVLTRKKVKTTWHLTWQIFWLLWQMQFWHISLEWWSETCEHCTVDNDMATGHQKRQIWFCCGCQTWFASREASSRFEASRQSIWKIFQRKGEIRWQTAIQAVAEYEFVVSNKSAPCFSAPPHSRLRNSIKTSDARNNVLQRSATRWNAGNRVVTLQLRSGGSGGN